MEIGGIDGNCWQLIIMLLLPQTKPIPITIRQLIEAVAAAAGKLHETNLLLLLLVVVRVAEPIRIIKLN